MSKAKYAHLATRFYLGRDEMQHEVTVESRDRYGKTWVVYGGSGSVYNTDGEWELEGMPSSRDDEFIARTRYSFDEATRIGLELVGKGPRPGQTVVLPDVKMYCVYSLEAVAAMKGSRGKLASMAGHAYLHSAFDAMDRFPEKMLAYRNGLARKITVAVPTQVELRALEAAYREVCGVSLVTDAGLTVFNGPTVVCLGIGPLFGSDCGDDLKALRPLT